MLCKPVYDFFLGTLSAQGFSGWFPQIIAEDKHTSYLIKAGPGCGKSTFMRRLAERECDDNAGDRKAVERLHCSSDPKSLDGVLLKGRRALVLDATAPHTVDCVYPDAAESVLSFYDTLDRNYLRRSREAILELGQRNTALLRQAGGHFGIVGTLLARRRSAAMDAVDTDKLQTFAKKLALRTIPPRKGAKPGIQRHRLLSAPTPGRVTVFRESIPQLAPDSLYAIDDNYGAVSALLLVQLAAHACKNGYEAYLCHCPTAQDKLEHLFIPELGLGFITSSSTCKMNFSYQKNLRAKSFMDMQQLAARKALLNWQKHLAEDLIAHTCTLQAEAKAVHDELEKYYVTATDFCAVDTMRTRTESEIFE